MRKKNLLKDQWSAAEDLPESIVDSGRKRKRGRRAVTWEERAHLKDEEEKIFLPRVICSSISLGIGLF